MLNVPVLFIIFNRLETTKQVFDVICKVKPKQIYIAADGPRVTHATDNEKCENVRSFVLKQIDWNCEVHTLFRKSNLGCGKAVSEAISWFFSNVEEGIILEDDCLPSETFFDYCEVLLEKYKYSENVMHISGNNPLIKTKCNDSYYFASIEHCWGWASWRRAWTAYDYNLNFPKEMLFKNKYFRNKYVRSYWSEIFNKMKIHSIDTWDYQWTLCILVKDGICINPSYNLVSNVGFADGTHYNNPDAEIAQRFQISDFIHPSCIKIDTDAVMKIDHVVFGIKYYKLPKFFKKMQRKCRNIYLFLNHKLSLRKK